MMRSLSSGLAPVVPAFLLICAFTGCGHAGPDSHKPLPAFPSQEGTHRTSPSDAPGFFSAEMSGRNRVILHWKDEFTNERGYIVERSAGKGFTEIARVDAGAVSFTDTRLEPAVTYAYRIRAYNSSGTSGCSMPVSVTTSPLSGPVIIDHDCVDLNAVPVYWVHAAKNVLHIAYGHTSQGSRVITGMEGLASFRGNLYAFNAGDMSGECLDIRDRPFEGAQDLGNPDRTAWERATREYLEENPEVNVVVWSWRDQADTTAENIELYLSLMEGLERDYPSVAFVYMTGHLNGTGLAGNLHQRNEQIRDFCRSKGKVLYDFADLESYDPDGNYFGNKFATDGCAYDSDMDGSPDANWALRWQASHVEGRDWYDCRSAHSQPLNANLKAYAAWWLWARLAGWDGRE